MPPSRPYLIPTKHVGGYADNGSWDIPADLPHWHFRGTRYTRSPIVQQVAVAEPDPTPERTEHE